MRPHFLAAGIAILSAAAAARAGDLDTILARHYQARGGMDKLLALKTVRYTGKMVLAPGMEAPITLEHKRPGRMRMEFSFQGMTGVRAYNAGRGWQIMPFGGRTTAEPMSPDQLKEAEEQADIDGPLVDWKKKGHRVELLGKDSVEGADAWKLELTLNNGDVRTIWLDAEYFLELKAEGKTTIRGSERETETSYGDYKPVGGILFPFVIEFGAKGGPERRKIVLESIELDVPLAEDRFVAPRAEAPAQPSPQD